MRGNKCIMLNALTGRTLSLSYVIIDILTSSRFSDFNFVEPGWSG